MERLESYLKEHFDVPPKNPSEEAQRRWRSAVGALVKNRRRRFRMVPDLHRRSLDEAQRRSTQVYALRPPPLPRTGQIKAVASQPAAFRPPLCCLLASLPFHRHARWTLPRRLLRSLARHRHVMLSPYAINFATLFPPCPPTQPIM
jgi:hypothetical protein